MDIYTHDALFTDFYELTMAQGYFLQKMNNTVVFDMFFRRNPFGGGFSILCGTKTLVEAITEFRFSANDIDFLRGQKIFCDDFLKYLADFHFTGDIYTMHEGEVIFPQEPLVQVHAPLIEAQILEGVILNIVNFQSLIATKTCRIHLSSRNKPIMEFGLRRAQGSDGAVSATRASFVGGAAGTSNTLAAKLFDIPAMGTMAHSWVMSFNSEVDAFRAYSQLYPQNSVFLIDTYDTLGSGIKSAITVGKELLQKGYNFGVRLDSGDIAYLTKECRKALDAAGLQNAKISVSNELTEEVVSSLEANNCPIDSFGVGTHMVTGGGDSSFTGVYKLAAKSDGNGNFTPVMKFSDNPEKTTNPGIKSVYRLYDAQGMAIADIISQSDEILKPNVEGTFYHPMVDYRQFSCAPSKVLPLLHKVIEQGKCLTPPLSQGEQIRVSKDHMESSLATFDPSYKRILNPHIYKVSLTQQLKDLKVDFIRHNIALGE